MFAEDRDLLAYEPRVFFEVAWTGQTVLSETASLSGTTLTLGAGSFTSAGVGAGWVLTTPAVSVEVIEVVSATVATVSLPRAARGDAATPPEAFTDQTVKAVTFGPQIARVHERLMRELGVALSGESETPNESAIVNVEQVRELEAVGALAMVYGAASGYAGGPDGERAQRWAEQFAKDRGRTRVELDLDGDGVADAARRFAAQRLSRAW